MSLTFNELRNHEVNWELRMSNCLSMVANVLLSRQIVTYQFW